MQCTKLATEPQNVMKSGKIEKNQTLKKTNSRSPKETRKIIKLTNKYHVIPAKY